MRAAMGSLFQMLAANANFLEACCRHMSVLCILLRPHMKLEHPAAGGLSLDQVHFMGILAQMLAANPDLLEAVDV